MSHYADIETEVNDQDALIEALIRMGFERSHIEVHEEAQHLYGYQNDRRNQKANVIVRRRYVGDGANDIGFEKTADGTYRAHFSEYERGVGNYS